jgi:DNA polymerase
MAKARLRGNGREPEGDRVGTVAAGFLETRPIPPYDRGMEPDLTIEAAHAILAWQAELGAEDPVGDVPVNRYDLPQAAPWLARTVPPGREAAPAVGRHGAATEHAPVQPVAPVPDTVPDPVSDPVPDPVAEARALAEAAASLADLAEVQSAYAHCDLKHGARRFVFADGNPAARVMVVGEAPGADEDREGRPFVGRAGQLLDRMFGAIGLSRGSPDALSSIYITNVMPWRPPQNREPSPEEIAMMLPFLERHIELAAPDTLVLMGNTPCAALLGQRGILKLRGNWTVAAGRPALPMTHPSYLLRTPSAKREAWADLLSLKARMMGGA